MGLYAGGLTGIHDPQTREAVAVLSWLANFPNASNTPEALAQVRTARATVVTRRGIAHMHLIPDTAPESVLLALSWHDLAAYSAHVTYLLGRELPGVMAMHITPSGFEFSVTAFAPIHAVDWPGKSTCREYQATLSRGDFHASVPRTRACRQFLFGVAGPWKLEPTHSVQDP